MKNNLKQSFINYINSSNNEYISIKSILGKHYLKLNDIPFIFYDMQFEGSNYINDKLEYIIINKTKFSYEDNVSINSQILYNSVQLNYYDSVIKNIIKKYKIMFKLENILVKKEDSSNNNKVIKI